MDLGVVAGQRLREIRLLRSLKQQVVAGEVGISVAALSAYERGTRTLTVSMLGQLADFYGVAPYIVVDGHELPFRGPVLDPTAVRVGEEECPASG